MTDTELIAAAIKASGLSGAAFAKFVAFGRIGRTVRYWRDGSTALTPGVRERLEWFLALPARERTRLLSILTR